MNWHRLEEDRSIWQGVLLVLAALFVLLTGISLGLVRESAISLTYVGLVLYWLVVVIVGYAVLRRYRPLADPLLYPSAALLLGWGMWLIERLAPNFLGRQLIWIALGLAVMVGTAVLPARLRPLRQYPYTWLFAGLILLGATLIFGVNPSGGGARLWLKIPLIEVYFQPSELLKLFFLVFLASFFGQREHLLTLTGRRALPFLAPLLLMWGFCLGLLVWQRDLGAATLFFIVFLALYYLATGRLTYVLAGLGLLLAASIFAYLAFDLVALRIDAWVNPWPEANNRAFQIVQSLYAIGAGGLFGEGIGQGFPFYIPVVHSDFAFAAIVEEWGMIGAIVVVVIFATLTFRAFRIALLARWPFDMYLAAGIGVMLGTQALLIMGGVTRLLPLTGVTLPFVSYGGSSLLVSSVMVGILLLLSERVQDDPQLERE